MQAATIPLDALGRTFRLVVFDWDGTAVVDRHADATPFRLVAERLLRAQVLLAVVTGTNAANIEAQFSASIRGPHKSNLYLCTNRGSEAYGFEGASPPVPLYVYRATPEEDRKLTEIAEILRGELIARTGLSIEVVANRVNRRKVDLIPTPEWRDPPKSAVGQLRVAVQSRLRAAGLAGGLHEALEMAERACREHGLPDARITSDVKHIEIGLTDKADSVRWLLREVAGPRAIANEDILIAGDEFGPTAGYPGSDDRMVIPEAAGAPVVSVGPEPAGVPPPVIHLGGGPARFRDLLAGQAERHPVTLPLTPTEDETWVLVEGPFVPAREHEVESIFSVGNGYVGARASLAEGSALSAPATFIAGVFDCPPGSATPELAPAPDWSHVQASVHGVPLSLSRGRALEHWRMLDLRQGVLWRQWRHRDDAGRITSVRGLRFASLADRHLLGQSIALTPENYGGDLAVHAVDLPREPLTHRGVRVAFAGACLLEKPRAFERVPMSFETQVSLGRTIRLDRVFAVERDDPDIAGERLEAALARDGMAGIVHDHCRAWEEAWRRSDVRLTGDADAQRALRFAVYHLVSAVDPGNERASIGARGMTGKGYGGHVFWDTEVFMLPFFTWTWPEAARALLMYRHHTLARARERARALGYAGALYAWESADTGEDVTPAMFLAPDGEIIPVFTGKREQHISADVAWGVWSYWQATRDSAFLLDAGAEILLETARFWASRATRKDDGLWHVDGVEGPDEYHDLVDDDAYTNWMAQWNLERGAEVTQLLAREWPEAWEALAARLGITKSETDTWLETAAGMYRGIDPATGIVEQFRGYFALEPLDLTPYAKRRAPMTVLLGPERVTRSQIIKQPDVVLLLHLLPERFSPRMREVNFRYYDARTDHGSSLSPAIHAAVAARLGDVDLAERYFRQTTAIDLQNDMGNSAGGVHVGALGGLWQAAVFGFAGLEVAAQGPVLRPNLPATWRSLELSVAWHGQRRALSATQGPPTALEPRPLAVAEGS
jgi:kojibiose phosphorylase